MDSHGAGLLGHVPPLREPVRPVSLVRSTIIVSGLQAFRARGLIEAYHAHLPEHACAPLLGLVAGQWIPVALALEHYRAADRLGLDASTIESIGAYVAERINKSPLSVMVKMSKELYVTPWTALASSQRLKDINWKGSEVHVVKLGPKEARFDWIGQPCAEIPYFVTSFGGFLRSLVSLFCTKAYVSALPDQESPAAMSYALSWV
jgi:hypothetical protein